MSIYLSNIFNDFSTIHGGKESEGGGDGAKKPTTSFSSAASLNVGISLQNVLTFSFNP